MLLVIYISRDLGYIIPMYKLHNYEYYLSCMMSFAHVVHLPLSCSNLWMCQYEHGFIIMQQETTYNIHLTTWSAFHRQKSNAKRNNKKTQQKNTTSVWSIQYQTLLAHITLVYITGPNTLDNYMKAVCRITF